MQILQNIRERLGTYPIEALDKLVETKRALIPKFCENAEDPFPSDNVDQSFAGTWADAAWFSFL